MRDREERIKMLSAVITMILTRDPLFKLACFGVRADEDESIVPDALANSRDCYIESKRMAKASLN